MAQVRDRLITREEASKLVRRMVRRGTMDYIIRDELLDRGLSVYESNAIIREVRQLDANGLDTGQHINPEVIEIGLTIITVVIVIMFLFLLIAPVQ